MKYVKRLELNFKRVYEVKGVVLGRFGLLVDSRIVYRYRFDTLNTSVFVNDF